MTVVKAFAQTTLVSNAKPMVTECIRIFIFNLFFFYCLLKGCLFFQSCQNVSKMCAQFKFYNYTTSFTFSN